MIFFNLFNVSDIMLTKCNYIFCIISTVTIDYVPEQHGQACLFSHNTDDVCLLWSRILIYISYTDVSVWCFKWINFIFDFLMPELTQFDLELYLQNWLLEFQVEKLIFVLLRDDRRQETLLLRFIFTYLLTYLFTYLLAYLLT